MPPSPMHRHARFRRYERRNGPPNIEGMVTLKVDNVPYNSSIEDLRRTFEK